MDQVQGPSIKPPQKMGQKQAKYSMCLRPTQERGKTGDKHTYSMVQAKSRCPGLGLNGAPEPMGSRVCGPGSQVSLLRAIKVY